MTLAERPEQDGSGFGFQEAKSGCEVTSRQNGVASLGECRSVPPKHHHRYNARDQTAPVAALPHALSAMRWELLPEVMRRTVILL